MNAKATKKVKPVPQVRQTLTSKLRLLKANPLMKYELEQRLGGFENNPRFFLNASLKTLLTMADDNKKGFTKPTLKVEVYEKSETKKFDNLVPKNKIIHQEISGRKAKSDKVINIKEGKLVKLKNKVPLKTIHQERNEENKENISLSIEQNENQFQINENNKENVLVMTEQDERLAQEALIDLHKLILEGYAPTQCEIWLKSIKQKYKKVEQKSQYWECRAALEQTKGNMNLAVECYTNAINNRSELKNEGSLDSLLHKFNLLKIDRQTPKCIKDDNIFNSSIIQFVVSERIQKKKHTEGAQIEAKMIATPVRRSMRLSRSTLSCSNSKMRVYATLRDVEPSVRQKLDFKCNEALRD